MLSEIISEYRALGLKCIPIEWDIEKKQPVSHRLWSEEYKELPLLPQHNALMIKTHGEYGCLDFDLKNTERKTIFDEWMNMVKYQNPDILSRVYIEETRNKGYHVWIKYKRLTKKISLAESDQGSEVIALYCGQPLVYTYPTPGYSEFYSSMADVDYLTDAEFEYLISTSQSFNEYRPDYDPNKKAANYPEGYESLLINFDTNLPDEHWETLLNEVGLVKIPNYQYSPKDKFIAYNRKGSTSPAISAKVYYKTKRVCIFSASMHQYPNWHNKQDYTLWSLPPSFLLFYKNGRDWDKTIEVICTIMDSIGMQNDFKPVSAENYTGFPLDVFPPAIKKSIIDVSFERSLPVQFTAISALWTISALAGTRYCSAFNGEGKNILFCLMIAPMSVGKTPAYRATCEQPLRHSHENSDKKYENDINEWNEEKAKATIEKKPFTKKRPQRYIPISADGTTEGYIQTSMYQKTGIGIYQDEAETIFNAGSFKSTNDAITFFTQAFSGGRVVQIRVDEAKTRVVPNLNLNLLMGTQPGRLKNIFTEDRLISGFASRFLMVESGYIELNTDSDPFSEKKEMCQEWQDIVVYLYAMGNEYNNGMVEKYQIFMGEGAKNAYRVYNKANLTEANSRIKNKAENYVIGTEAKMSAYFPRLIQILAILHNPHNPEITEDIVHKGWQLYKFFACETVRVISGLHGEIETGLPKDLDLLYQALPNEFTRKEAVETCKRININERRFDVSMRRKDFAALFIRKEQGKYEKK